MSPTRRVRLLLVGICLCTASQCFATEPYEARVVSEQIFTRSGPGENYYPTGYLSQGAIVEVYREDSNGWLAIRPPEDQFSLVRVEDVRHGEDRHLATVSKAGAPSYVGSTISDHHHVVHVKLDQEEPIAILGILELRHPDSGKKEAWYRISPPAGEFRWVHRQFVEVVSPKPPMSLAAQPDSAAIALALEEEPREWRRELQAVAYKQESANSDEGEGEKPGNLPIADRIASLDLVQLELKLSQEVVRPIQEWDLAPLAERARRLAQNGETPLERGKARLLIEKIGEFTALHERKIALKEAFPEGATSVMAAGAQMPESDSHVADSAKGRSIVDPAAHFEAEDFDPRYDGRGWLMPVVTRASKPASGDKYTPPFALTDDSGNVLQFVSPSPGMNLRRYSRMRVGIYGQVSPLDQYTRPHLTAHRVVVLARHEKP